MSPDGTKLITNEAQSYDPKGARSVPHTTVFRDLSGNGPPVELATGYAMAAFAPDGKMFALAASDQENGSGQLRLFDALTGKEIAVLTEGPKHGVFGPVFSPDGKRIAVAEGTSGTASATIKVWDVPSRKELAALVPAEPAKWLRHAFCPDGRFVAASADKGVGYVWDAATGKLALTLRIGEKGLASFVAVSPDGRRAATVGRPELNREDYGRDPDPADLPQPRVVLYDLTTGKPLETLVCPPGIPGRAAFSPDGRTLAVGSYGAVHLFDVK